MTQNIIPEQKPNVAELVLSMAISGRSWDEFTDSIADKVASKLMGIIPDKKEVEPCTTGEKPLRGVRALVVGVCQTPHPLSPKPNSIARCRG